ncbi:MULTISPECIES: GntR family transcriptional regulator [unclassified Luteococcus]|uniref:GntR family transcriptional regulator n=1 Tax=unclassified Luteococcus TaxID=2639923 RepID=UPI00313EEA7B
MANGGERRAAAIGAWTLVIDAGLPDPPYSQLVNRVAEAISGGELPPGTKLPSVRALATALGLATNTVAKAYRQLEAEGQVETRGRNGTVVLSGAVTSEASRVAARLVQSAKADGLDLDEAIGLVRRCW